MYSVIGISSNKHLFW